MATPTRRIRIAQLLALVALLAALIGALGPAERVRTTYSWPPSTLPAGDPDRLWYAPLLLIRQQPELLSADVPCTPSPALPTAEPGRILATARYPERAGGLAITQSRRELVVTVGRNVLDRVRLPSGGGAPDCAHRITIAGGRWSISGGDGIEREGLVEAMPVVTGLFSGLDLRSGRPPSVAVTTQVHATRTTTRQVAAWAIAALAGVAALLLVVFPARPRRLGAASLRLLARAVAGARVPDAVVGVALLGWWVLSPAYLDDGWVIARELMFSSSRGFSNYYSNIGANLPLNYWHEWLEHWLVQAAADSLLVLRLQALLCLALTWVCCRWVLTRVLASSVGESRTALWSMTAVFLVGAMSWGMTLRPEPLTALLVMGVVVCIVFFLERQSTAPVALAAVLVALALSSHHAGIVSFAPLLVAAPQLARWVRARIAVGTTVVAATSALLATLLFVGSDLEQRRLDAQITRLYGATDTWRDEIARYALLSELDYGTSLRRLSVVLLGLPILAFLCRARRERRGLLDFPAAVLTVSVVLLVLTPSKWPSHFGALIGVAAVAFAAEAARLRDEAGRESRWRAWPFVALVAVTAGAAWSWWTREQWNVVDLRTLGWFPAFEEGFPLSQLATLLPLFVLAATVVVLLVQGRRAALSSAPWAVAAWSGPLLAAPLIAFTAGMLVADAAKTDGWTLTRQNLESIAGDRECGLAEDLVVPARGSARPLESLAGSISSGTPAWVPRAPIPTLPRFALGPTGDGAASTPWFRLPGDGRFGIYLAGVPSATDTVRIDWGRGAGRVEPVRSDQVEISAGELTGNSPWRLFAAGDLPAAAPGANVLRATLESQTAPGAALAVTSPVTYRTVVLSRLLNGSPPTLVLPNLLTYFPCTDLPALRAGIVEVPRYVLVSENPHSPIRYPISSPFAGLIDVYELERLSTADSSNAPAEAIPFEVDGQIPGALEAPPVRETLVS